MLIESFAAGPWQTNCYIVAPSANSECIIIDPGKDAAPGVRDALAAHNLLPVAVMVTHGHIDHMWSVFPIASGYHIPALIHSADRSWLADPTPGLSQQTREALPSMLGTDEFFADPQDVVELADQMRISLAGFDITIHHAPGHTAGSALFEFADVDPTVFTGDVVFAGAIGRTDLPSGSPEQMDASLRDVVLSLSDDKRIFPGHGPSSTIAIERLTNPYLVRIAQGLSAT